MGEMGMEKGERFEKYGGGKQSGLGNRLDTHDMSNLTSSYIYQMVQTDVFVHSLFYFSLVLLPVYILNSYLIKLQLDGD